MILQRKVLTPLLILVLIWLGYLVFKVRAQRDVAVQHVHDLESKIADTQESSQLIASSSAYLSSDAYLERQARLKLNYKYPDENVAFVYQDKSVKTDSNPDQTESGTQISIWKRLWLWINK